jgi:hypothetical protein
MSSTKPYRPVEAYEDTEARDMSEMDPDERAAYVKRHNLDKGPRIVVPKSRTDIERALRARPCITCIHFDLEGGQREAIRERFWDNLRDKHSHAWPVKDWFTNPKEYGLCLAFSSDESGRLTNAYSPGTCRQSDFDSTIKPGSTDDKTIPCTEWSPKDRGRQKKTKGRWNT